MLDKAEIIIKQGEDGTKLTVEGTHESLTFALMCALSAEPGLISIFQIALDGVEKFGSELRDNTEVEIISGRSMADTLATV